MKCPIEITKYLDKTCLILAKVLNDVLQERFRERFAEDPAGAGETASFRERTRDRALIRVTASIISVFKSRPLSHPVIESFVEITPGVRLAFRDEAALPLERLFFSPRVI